MCRGEAPLSLQRIANAFGMIMLASGNRFRVRREGGGGLFIHGVRWIAHWRGCGGGGGVRCEDALVCVCAGGVGVGDHPGALGNFP